MPVSGLDIRFRRPLADGRSWGDVGPYEEIRGTLRFTIDPENDANIRITDAGRAARDSDGRVEFSIRCVDHSTCRPLQRQWEADAGCSEPG